MFTPLMGAPSGKLVGDKVQREELTQDEGARGRIEGIRQESERDMGIRTESISDEDSVMTHKLEKVHALTEANISRAHDMSMESKKKRFRSKANRSNNRPNGSG